MARERLVGGKVQLPAEVREALRLLPRDSLQMILTEGRDAVVLRPIRLRAQEPSVHHARSAKVIPLRRADGPLPSPSR